MIACHKKDILKTWCKKTIFNEWQQNESQGFDYQNTKRKDQSKLLKIHLTSKHSFHFYNTQIIC